MAPGHWASSEVSNPARLTPRFCLQIPPHSTCLSAHQFMDPGTYMFQDSGCFERIAVVLVKEE